MSRLRSIPAKLRTLARVDPRRRRLVVEAAASLTVARLALAVLPFRRVAARLGSFVPPSDPRVPALTPGVRSDEARIAREIGWAVQSIAPWLPFRAKCLQQALAAHAMLRRRGIACVTHFGAHRDADRKMEAHAWLDAAGVKVTGYPMAPSLREIGCFV